jgi:hypothetical protein
MRNSAQEARAVDQTLHLYLGVAVERRSVVKNRERAAATTNCQNLIDLWDAERLTHQVLMACLTLWVQNIFEGIFIAA